ncbi:hypothetical protein [Limosilactobacillus reuteri]|uniref:hypothetical protein n=1 Tax=Limosilactobacillus reuteri TaxID=1598 RepID=UPI001C5B2D26|nr:hypothetical protein [Limosilactobacillus reuteri]MBW3349870.1 hypothetical protein [Limosilactobacillus reuteri]UUW67720.1 hypothetical protein NUJ10_06755 [Limosilactobacillus reuteri]
MKIDEFCKKLNRVAYVKTNRAGIIRVYAYGEICLANKHKYIFEINPKVDVPIINTHWENADDMPPFSMRELLNSIAELEKTPVKERFPEKKYTIQVIANYDSAYLNCYKESNRMTFYDDIETDHVKTRFTQAEIDELKQRDDLAIDWDKAIIKEVKGDED